MIEKKTEQNISQNVRVFIEKLEKRLIFFLEQPLISLQNSMLDMFID
jgi:hypothetical protein